MRVERRSERVQAWRGQFTFGETIGFPYLYQLPVIGFQQQPNKERSALLLKSVVLLYVCSTGGVFGAAHLQAAALVSKGSHLWLPDFVAGLVFFVLRLSFPLEFYDNSMVVESLLS